MRKFRFISSRQILVAGVCFLGVTTSTVMASEDRVFSVSEKPALTDKYPKPLVSWPDGVTSIADVTYSTIVGYRPMIVDIYMPSRDVGPKPLILHVHGGGWVAGHTRHSGALSNFPAVLAKLASEGFVVASLEYRLANEAKFPAQVQDARAALRFLKNNADKYGIDKTKTGIWGGSAGGHLTALTALSCGDASLDVEGKTYEEGSECAQAAVTWYGVFDFGVLAAGRPDDVDGAASRLLGCEGSCQKEAYAKASPVTYIDSNDPPMLLIHGEKDGVVPVAQSRLAEQKLKSAGVTVESLYIPGVDHSLIGSTYQQTTQATLKTINATFDFFHKVLD